MEYRHRHGLVVFLPLQSTGGRFIHGNVRPIAVADTVSVYAWNQSTGKVTDVLTGHNGQVCGVDFHPDESLLFLEEISHPVISRLRAFSDISDSLETDAKGDVLTMHRQTESLVKAVELMRESQEDNADSDDDEDDKRGEDGDTTALRETLSATTRMTCDMTRRDRRYMIGTKQWSSNIS